MFTTSCLLVSCNSVPCIPVHIHVITCRPFQVRRASMYHWVISSGFCIQTALKAVSANLAFLCIILVILLIIDQFLIVAPLWMLH